MTMPAILGSARAMSYYTRLQAVTANNLANVTTEGFKADRLTAHATNDGSPVPVSGLDLSQGTLRETGRPLDVGLDGAGFLVVQTPNGDRLTRSGSLKLDKDGYIADHNGNPVLGAGGPIRAIGGEINIDSDGTVNVDGKSVGQLRLVNVDDPSSLTKLGQGLYTSSSPTTPATLTVHQGALEDANVNPLLGMVDMVGIQRAFTANTDVVHVLDGVMGTVTGDIGKP